MHGKSVPVNEKISNRIFVAYASRFLNKADSNYETKGIRFLLNIAQMGLF